VAIITYSVGTGCAATISVTVNAASLTISGPSSMCAGGTVTLSSPASGGSWNSSNSTVATVNSTGTVYGVGTGVTLISYTAAVTCGTVTATHSISIGNASVITTLAGGGSILGDGGPATAGSMSNPPGVFVDASGNVLVADFGGSRVRMISPTGDISTIAGNGVAASTGDGGPASAATVNAPAGVCKDAAGNIYIAEQNGHRIRKIDVSGNISTFAGTGSVSYTSGDGGPATGASLNHPTSVVADASGNVYIAEWGGRVVRMVNTSGIITTIAGGGSSTADGVAATAASLYTPYGISLDGLGNLFIGEEFQARVRQITWAQGLLPLRQVPAQPDSRETAARLPRQ
jgi:hypothetical protein